MSWWTILIICGAAIFAVFLIYIYRYEPFNFKLNDIRIDLDLPGPPGEEEKLFTILHLSDFHLRKSFKGRKLYEFIQTLGNGEYDFIFITGDMVENLGNAHYLVDMLSPLRARYGKYAVLGVHDHYNKAFYEFARNMFKRKRKYNSVNDTRELAGRLKAIGIEVLDNESRALNILVSGIERMELIGLDDPVIEKLDLYKAFLDIDPLKKGEVVDGSNFHEIEKDVFELHGGRPHHLHREGVLRMVLLHTPDSHVLSTLYNKQADIILSGHTHGGQVRLPLLGAIISGCRIKTKFASGLFYFKGFVLFISRGLGEGRYSQFRCYCPPEAVRISVYGVHGPVENF